MTRYGPEQVQQMQRSIFPDADKQTTGHLGQRRAGSVSGFALVAGDENGLWPGAVATPPCALDVCS